MKVLFFTTILLITYRTACASVNVDSLGIVLSKTKADSIALKDYLSLLAKLDVNDDPARIIIGNWLIERGLQTSNFEIASKACNELGSIYIEGGNREAASSYLNKGLAIAEEHEIYHVQFRLLNGLGVLYKEMGQIDLAIEYYKKAITQGQKSEKTNGLGKAYYNLAGLYVEQGYQNEDTLKQALNMCQYGLQLSRKSKDTTGIITCLGGVASIYIDLQEYDSAKVYFEMEYEMINKIGEEVRFISYYQDLAWLMISTGDFGSAIEYCYKSLDYAEKYKQPKARANCYDWLAYCYEQVGDFKKANEYMVYFRDLNDSLSDAANFETIHNLRVQYETEEKEHEILKLNQDNEIKQLRIQQKEDKLFILEVIVGLTIVILLTLGVLVFFLVRLNRVRLATNIELEKKNKEIQKQSAALNEQSRMISKYQSQMNPHFVFNALHNIQGFVVKGNTDKSMTQLQLLGTLMRSTLNNSDNDFIPLSNEVDYLKNYVSFEQSRFNNKLNFIVRLPEDSDEWLIPPMLIQPFIENAVKHAGFHMIENPEIILTFSIEGECFVIKIKDNGKGFDKRISESVKSTHAISIIKSRLGVIWDMSGKKKPSEILMIESKFESDRSTQVIFYLPSKFKY